mmetsp:Transcript_20242/g.29815  ORF Transcript_20242/g.29815 Transcript_20242/m.29815 type:complete len:204 (-) Transcript_20242:471-1082(-)
MYPVAINVKYLPMNKSIASSTSLDTFDVSPKALTVPLAITTGIFFPSTPLKSIKSSQVSFLTSSFGLPGPTILFLKGPNPISNVTGFPFARSKAKPPNKRHGAPTSTSAYVTKTETILVEPTKINVEARANMVPAKNVSTVSCKGRIHFKPSLSMKGPTASLKKDSTTQSSNLTRSKPPAINGPYSIKLSSPTIDFVEVCAKR